MDVKLPLLPQSLIPVAVIDIAQKSISAGFEPTRRMTSEGLLGLLGDPPLAITVKVTVPMTSNALTFW